MIAQKEKVLKLLKTAKGQIDGLIKMCEADRCCIEISNQILASQSILKKVNLDILKGHFSHCVKESLINDGENDSGKIEEKIDEIIMVLDKILK